MSPKPAADAIDILLVEDDADDARLTREAFKDGRVRNALHEVSDGVEALEFLHKTGRFAGSPVPDLILLDLNLPRKSGHEVLKEIKSDPNLKQIPVIILTTSSADEDVLKSYGLNANCYIAKPVDLDQFFKVIRTIDDFWLTIAKLPPHH